MKDTHTSCSDLKEKFCMYYVCQVVVPKDGSEWVEEFEKEAELGTTTNGGFWDRLEKEWEDLAK